MCTRLDRPSLMATASSGPELPAASEPAQPAGAAALGISAVQIARRGARSMTPAARTAVVQSLAELDAML